MLVTAPVDRRLATDPGDPDHVPRETCEVRATIISPRKIVRCTCGIDVSPDEAMREIAPRRYVLSLELPADATTIGVEAEDDQGWIGVELVEIARHVHLAVEHRADGSDADSVGAWESRGIFGTQLGPNRNGRKW